ncbi:MAG: aspartate kinase [candidate division WOR-3 bacterium]
MKEYKIRVLKFGGSSVARINFIKRIASMIKKLREEGIFPVIVVSAMGDTTDKLLYMAKKISKNPDKRELDMLLSSGERISMALLAMALKEKGVPARSFTGSQVGIITDTRHGNARIIDIKCERIKEAIKKGEVPIIAGFQGISLEKEVTTLGRGGSDLTAVAIAKALNLKEVYIYTDVDGVYTFDPKLLKKPKRIERLSYEEMLEFSKYGAKVLHDRAVSLAGKEGIIIKVLSSFNSKGGTIIEEIKYMEKREVKGMTLDKDNTLFLMKDVPLNPEYVSQVLTRLAENGINVKIFLHGIPLKNKFDMSFVVSKDEDEKTENLLKKFLKELKGENLIKKKNLSILSLIGYGIGEDTSIIKKVLEIFAREEVHIEGFFPSQVRVSFLFSKKNVKRIIKEIAREFNLSK